jgi:hypothetical protein
LSTMILPATARANLITDLNDRARIAFHACFQSTPSRGPCLLLRGTQVRRSSSACVHSSLRIRTQGRSRACRRGGGRVRHSRVPGHAPRDVTELIHQGVTQLRQACGRLDDCEILGLIRQIPVEEPSRGSSRVWWHSGQIPRKR